MSEGLWNVDPSDAVDSPCQRCKGSVFLFLVARSILAARDGAGYQLVAGGALLEECCTKMQVSESAK